jgi:hypothetical protein
MTKYERIHQMRLDHAAGCTEPPVKESRVTIETMSKRMEREIIIGDHERFTFNHPERAKYGQS